MSDLEKQSDKTAESGSKMGLAIGVAATAAAAGYANMVKGAIDAADSAYTMRQRLGLSTEALTTFQFAAKTNNVEVNTLNSSLNHFADTRDARGRRLETIRAGFRDMGVSVTDASGKVKSIDQLLPRWRRSSPAMRMGLPRPRSPTACSARAAQRLFRCSTISAIRALRRSVKEAEKMASCSTSRRPSRARAARSDRRAHDRHAGLLNTVARDVLPNLIAFAKGPRRPSEGGEQFQR